MYEPCVSDVGLTCELDKWVEETKEAVEEAKAELVADVESVVEAGLAADEVAKAKELEDASGTEVFDTDGFEDVQNEDYAYYTASTPGAGRIGDDGHEVDPNQQGARFDADGDDMGSTFHGITGSSRARKTQLCVATTRPTATPTAAPTKTPTLAPTTAEPSLAPTTLEPTAKPTKAPTGPPTTTDPTLLCSLCARHSCAEVQMKGITSIISSDPSIASEFLAASGSDVTLTEHQVGGL
jgi:hypothetical protein